MSSEFQRRKVATVVTAMDVDGDGYLERSDFEALSRRWTEIRDWPPGSDGHTRLTEIMMGWWSTLLAASDQDRDDKVTLDEVLLVVDRLPAMPEAVTGTADAMFDAIDENADDAISAEEYRQLIEAWTGQATDTDEAFTALDLNADGTLSRAEFTAHWYEFWAGTDEQSPATHIFGRVP